MCACVYAIRLCACMRVCADRLQARQTIHAQTRVVPWLRGRTSNEHAFKERSRGDVLQVMVVIAMVDVDHAQVSFKNVVEFL